MGRGVQDDGGHHAPRRAKLRFARPDSSGCAGTAEQGDRQAFRFLRYQGPSRIRPN
jgi:hypothetical protein